jgi:hypothetical protein
MRLIVPLSREGPERFVDGAMPKARRLQPEFFDDDANHPVDDGEGNARFSHLLI